MTALRTVLATREVPALLSTSLVGRLPTAMAALAVLLLVRGQGGDYTLAGTLTALFTAGSAVGQPALARIVDQRGQPRVLLVAAITSGAAFVVLAATGTDRPVASGVAAALAGLGTPPLEPCLRALWPAMITDVPALRAAFSLDVGLQEIVFVAGPLLAVAAVACAGNAGGVLACSGFGLAGTVGFAATRTSRDWRPAAGSGRGRGSPVRHASLVRVFAAALACGVPVGALAIVAAAYASTHGSTAITGWALAANAAGALAAGLLGAVRPNRHTGPAALTGAALALAAGYLPLALPVPVGAWLPLCAVSGLALPVVLSLVFQRVQLLCPPNLLTEANAWVITAFGLGAAVAALLAGIATDRLGHAVAVPAVIVVGAAFTAIVGVASYRKDDA